MAPPGVSRYTTEEVKCPANQKISTPLYDPNDPLVSGENLITCALEVLSELRNGLLSEEPPAIVNTDPEWLDASFEYLDEVLEALKERQV